MSDGLGDIAYNSRSGGAVPPFVNIAGARNGTSLDASNFVTLGQAVNQPGAPAILLNNREISGGNVFKINYFAGRLILSDTQNAGVGLPAGRLEVYENNSLGGTTKRLAYFQTTVVTGADNAGMTINQVTTDNGPAGIIAFDIRKNNIFCFTVNPAAANATFNDPFGGGQAFASFTGARYNNTTLRNAVAINPNLQINSLWHPNATVTPASVVDIEVISTVTLDNAAEVDYTALLITGVYSQPAAGLSQGSFRGVWYQPTIGAALIATPIAFENDAGHVFLCNNRGTTPAPGMVSIAKSYLVGDTPQGFLEIGAQTSTAPNSAPLVLNGSGTLLAAPQQGAFEYNAVNLFFTPTATRLSVFMGTDAAAAPGTSVLALPGVVFGATTALLGTPPKWAPVIIGGITYKIPLYT